MNRKKGYAEDLIFISDGFVPSVLLVFWGALDLCKAVTVCVYLILNKAPSQQEKEKGPFLQIPF